MFGLLDPNSCGLAKEMRSFYSCNVCNALSSKFGRTSRVMLSNDSVYLSFLIAGQRDQIPYKDFTHHNRCRPWSRQSLCLTDFEYPAAVSMLISGVRLLDDTHDVASLQSRVLFALNRSKIKAAEEKLGELGLDLPSISDLLSEQHRREATIGRELGYYSRTTEEIYSKIFSHTATLAGAQSNSNHLAEVGLQVGRIAYLLDNYVDFQNDKSRGVFNLFNHLSSIDPQNSASGSSRQFLEEHVNECLQRIRENIFEVRLHRLQSTIRYIVTDGLRLKVTRAIAGAGSLLPRATLYSATPTITAVVLKTSSSDSCCDCSSSCSDICALEIQDILDELMETIAMRFGQGVVAAGIAVAASTLLSALTSHLGATTPPPHEEPGPPSTEEQGQPPDKPPESVSEGTSQPPSEPPPETTPEEPRGQEEPRQQTQETPRTVLSPDEIRNTLVDGLCRNRSPEDINGDLRDLNWVQGGSGDVDLTDYGGRLVTVRTESGEEMTATQAEANRYNRALNELNRIKERSEEIHEEMTRLENESTTWREVEAPGWGWKPIIDRTYRGTRQLSEAYRDYQNELSRIDQQYHKPDPNDPDLPTLVGRRGEYERRLMEYERRPEVKAERTRAHTEYTQRVDSLTSGRYQPGEPTTRGYGTLGPDGEPQVPQGPLSDKSAFTRPAAELERIQRQQEAYIKELKQLAIEKSKARTQMDLAGITDRQRILNKYGDQISRTRYGRTGQ